MNGIAGDGFLLAQLLLHMRWLETCCFVVGVLTSSSAVSTSPIIIVASLAIMGSSTASSCSCLDGSIMS